MKKKYLYISFLSIALIGIPTSCNTDRFPETSISDGNFWNTAQDVKLAANYFYTTLPGLPETSDGWGPYAASNTGSTSISDGSRVAPSSSGTWNNNYRYIFRANKLIEMAPKVIAKGENEQEINRYIGEARFFRAFYYYSLLIRFGGVPIILKTMQIDDPDLYKPRNTREEVYTQIIEDLDYAISVLPTPDEIPASEYGRVSNTAALAFKSRVALFEGTRQKFHSYGDWRTTLQSAFEAAEQVINSGFYSLNTNPTTGPNGEIKNTGYFDNFQYQGEGRQNRENILVRIYGIDRNDPVSSHNAARIYAEGYTMAPTWNFVQKYLMVDGLPIDKSPLYHEPDANATFLGEFKGRDPRIGFTLFKKGDPWQSNRLYDLPIQGNNEVGYAMRKFSNGQDWQYQQSFIDRPIIRYAEVLLNYIEAKFELNGAVSDQDLNLTINALRARLPEVNIGTETNPNFVAMAKLTNAFVANHGLNMRTEIRRERLIELAYEGFSYWDLIRWKTAETEFPKDILGCYLYTNYITDAGWDPTTEVNDDNYILIQSKSRRSFNPQRDYLWPLPKTEIAINPKLEQNPLWGD